MPKKRKKYTYKSPGNSKIHRLKNRRKELLKEADLSMAKFKEKMPRIILKKNGDFEVSETRQGKVPSLWQQVTWLEEFVTATKELREELYEKQQEEAKQNKKEDLIERQES